MNLVIKSDGREHSPHTLSRLLFLKSLPGYGDEYLIRVKKSSFLQVSSRTWKFSQDLTLMKVPEGLRVEVIRIRVTS